MKVYNYTILNPNLTQTVSYPPGGKLNVVVQINAGQKIPIHTYAAIYQSSSSIPEDPTVAGLSPTPSPGVKMPSGPPVFTFASVGDVDIGNNILALWAQFAAGGDWELGTHSFQCA